MERFFPKNTKKTQSRKQLSSSGDLWPKFGGGAGLIITQRFRKSQIMVQVFGKVKRNL